MAKRRSFRKRKYARKSRKGRRSRGRKVSLKKMVRREIARSVEVKSCQQQLQGRNIYGPTNPSFTTNIIPLGPYPGLMPIEQGPGNGARIGNRIRTKSLVFRGVIVPTPWTDTVNPQPQPQQVKMVIFYDRENPNTVPDPITGNDFFQFDGANQGFLDDIVDNIRTYNTDRYRILTTRTFKLGFANYGGSGALAQWQQFTNNDFKLNANFKINLTKYYPKRVRFDENDVLPTTRGLYCFFYTSAASGGANNATIPATVQYTQDYRYTDA